MWNIVPANSEFLQTKTSSRKLPAVWACALKSFLQTSSRSKKVYRISFRSGAKLLTWPGSKHVSSRPCFEAIVLFYQSTRRHVHGKKSPVTPPGIDPGTVRLVAQCLNHYANPDPLMPIMIINRIYETQNLLSLYLVSFLVGLRTYQHPCIWIVFYNSCIRIFALWKSCSS
jgi:hypothetical protein